MGTIWDCGLRPALGACTTAAVGLALLFLLNGCSDQKLEGPGGGGRGDTLLGDAAGAVTWESDVRAIFAAHCATCHAVGNVGAARDGAPPGVNFDTYEDAIESAGRGLLRMSTGTMPPPRNPVGAEPVDEDALALVQAWLDAGMPR
jgi:mono/diheme cytochrome c family protein